MYPATSRLLTLLLGYLVAQAKTYPVQGWHMQPQSPRVYNDDDYYYAPKIQYYYDAPAMSMPDAHGMPYPYYYDPYDNVVPNEMSKEHEERMAALPIGQETWFESAAPNWRTNDIDDVNAAFLDNLILTQMAQDATRRRQNTRAAFAPLEYEDNQQNREEEDERELKALAGKPLYHEPKTVPKFEDIDEDYPADDGFINWNGNKRSPTTTAPTTQASAGQAEVMVPRPAQTHHQNKEQNNFYKKITQLLANQPAKTQESPNKRRIEKRFVAGDSDLVRELRGLKHRIQT